MDNFYSMTSLQMLKLHLLVSTYQSAAQVDDWWGEAEPTYLIY